MSQDKYRLVTRADFDGVVCGTLFNELGLIDDVSFAEPKEMQDGAFPVGARDISANLPFVEGVHLCFDHHVSEVERVGGRDNHIIDAKAPSAARVVYNHYGGADAFPDIPEDLLRAVDKADSAQYSEEEILVPEDWTLLNFVLDARTGLDRSAEYSVLTDRLMVDLMTYCRHNPIDEILALPEIAERVNTYVYQKEFAELQLLRCGNMQGHSVVVDFRDEAQVYTVNRFMVYALFPTAQVSVTVQGLADSDLMEIAVGRSILDRTSRVNIGSLLLEFGGGGHSVAGTCRLPDAEVDAAVSAIVSCIDDAVDIEIRP